ncbi:MAG TPA: serine/threonine-protein kinase [Kofleriaceae bacterium]
MVEPPRYQLLGTIASGGMAEVLLARTSGPNGFERLLAVKRIRPELSGDPEHVRMFLDEARNAARLVHHNIVQVIDVDLRDGAVFYAMEYLHGQTLDAVMKRGALPRDAAIAIAIGIAAGLHHAHERASSIVHRDVAPSNVIVTYDGNVKLIDFGIAKATENLSRTAFGVFKGRLGYSSPEQVRCELVDRRSDIYSLGLVLYELATGRPAFATTNESELVDRMADAKLAPPTGVEPALQQIIMRAVAKDPGDRYPTADAMQLELEAFARANRLNLSAMALSRVISERFAEELAPWQAAQATGVTLERYITLTIGDLMPVHERETWSLSRAGTAEAVTVDRETLVRHRPAKSSIRRLEIAAMIGLFGAAYLLARLIIS